MFPKKALYDDNDNLLFDFTQEGLRHAEDEVIVNMEEIESFIAWLKDAAEEQQKRNAALAEDDPS